MIKIGFVTNPLDPATWVEVEADDPIQAIAERFPIWPSTARIFDLEGMGDWTRVATAMDAQAIKSRDITPPSKPGRAYKRSVKRLRQTKGPVLVTLAPADPSLLFIAVAAIVVGFAAAFLLIPKIPSAGRTPSPNNALSDRSNQPRINQRIAEIYGSVESVPDVVMQPYSIFDNDQEVEVGFYLIGRGSYAISRVRDGETSIASIAGASAAIYGPYSSPNNGTAPQLQIGAAIPELVETVQKLNDVNGQTLQPTNLDRVQGEDSIRFVYPDTIETNDSDLKFTDYFAAGDAIAVNQAAITGDGGFAQTIASARFNDAGEIEFETINPSTTFIGATTITLSNAGYSGDTDLGGTLYVGLDGTYPIASMTSTKIILDDPAGINSDWDKLDQYPGDQTTYRDITFSVPVEADGLNLNGNYTLLSVTDTTLVLNNPALVNTDWNDLADLDDGATDYVSPSISKSTETWVGPFIVDLDLSQFIQVNVVALNGLYTLSKKKGKQRALTVGYALEVTPVNANDAAIGPAETFTGTISGSATKRTTVGKTLRVEPSFSGRCSIRMRRTTASPDEDEYGAISDELKWRDAYGMAPVGDIDFGDVTTVMTRTIATAGALSVKQRKLNMQVTRMLPERISGSTFGDLVATQSSADIIAAMCLDPYIGRRVASEVDFDSIYDTIAEVVEYFGSSDAGHFNYTFDDSDVSFEEMVQTVAQANFCAAYRQGRVIRLTFERAREIPSLIFNSKNIYPGTMKRNARFGTIDDHDGVEIDYVDPDDSAPLTYQIPPYEVLTSPRSVEIQGIRSRLLAYWQGWRARNKDRFTNFAVEFDASAEASLIIPNDLIFAVDRTRPGSYDGEIVAEDGTTLTLSRKVSLDPAQRWTIFLQHIDGSTEAIDVEQGPSAKKVIVAASPRAPLSIDANNYARATFIIVPDDDFQTRKYIVTERKQNSTLSEGVTAINYTFLFYQHDQLMLWLDFGETGFTDSSPYLRDGTAQGDGALDTDLQRGPVYEGGGAGDGIALVTFAPPASYTKLGWVKRSDTVADGEILGSAGELFGFDGDQLRAGHGSSAVQAPSPSVLEWAHLAVTYDASTQAMTLYVNGTKVDEAAGVSNRTLTQLSACSGLAGQADDIRLYPRALTDDEVRTLWIGGKPRGYDTIRFDSTEITFDSTEITFDRT